MLCCVSIADSNTCLLAPEGISALQFQAVQMACAKHETFLADGKTRSGFFLGDGAPHPVLLLARGRVLSQHLAQNGFVENDLRVNALATHALES